MTPITRSMASKMTPMEASIDASHPPAIESFSSETTSTPEECVLDDKRRFTSEELFHMPQFEFSVVKNTESDCMFLLQATIHELTGHVLIVLSRRTGCPKGRRSRLLEEVDEG